MNKLPTTRNTCLILVFAFVSAVFAHHSQAAQGIVPYEIDGERFEGYYLSPKVQAPLVILVHDWDGITAYEQQRAQMLVELGYAVFAPDLYGAGIRPTAPEDKKNLTAALYKNRERMRKLLNGGIQVAKQQGADTANSIAMGYCFGGAAVLELARSGADLKGFVSFHGGLETPEGQNYRQVRGKILVLHGTADASVSMEQFANLAQTLEEQAKPHEMITYSGAPHAFTVFGTDRYREDADKKSWRRFTEFLSEILVSR